MAAPGGRGQVEMRGQHRSLFCPKPMYETKTKKASRCGNKRMEAQPTPTTDDMAVEPNEVNESAAERQEPGPEALFTDADLEGSPAKKRKVCKSVCTFM